MLKNPEFFIRFVPADSLLHFNRVFSDIDESEKCRFNYQCCIAQEKKGYTLKKLKEQKEFFGVYVLQTNSSKSAQEVFESNKNVGGL